MMFHAAPESKTITFLVILMVACDGSVDLGRDSRESADSGWTAVGDAGSTAHSGHEPDASHTADAGHIADASRSGVLDADLDAGGSDGAAATDAAAGDAGSGYPTPRVASCSNPTVIEVDPTSARAVVDMVSRDAAANVRLDLSPGSYGKLSFDAPVHCMEIRCLGGGECRVVGLRLDAWLSGLDGRPRYGTVIVEGLTFVGRAHQSGGSNDYGIAIYGVDQIRVESNTFRGAYNHDISTKEAVTYAEVLNNTFIQCARHCIEVGQNGNVPPRPSTSGTLVVRGNVFDTPMINAITQRYNLHLIIDGNEFRNVSGNSLQHWPMWKPYAWNGASAPPELNRIPRPARLRTEVVNNRFVGENRLRLGGRGVIDDVVLIRENQGRFTCQREQMTAREADAHFDEETLDPPTLDPRSDVEC